MWIDVTHDYIPTLKVSENTPFSFGPACRGTGAPEGCTIPQQHDTTPQPAGSACGAAPGGLQHRFVNNNDQALPCLASPTVIGMFKTRQPLAGGSPAVSFASHYAAPKNNIVCFRAAATGFYRIPGDGCAVDSGFDNLSAPAFRFLSRVLFRSVLLAGTKSKKDAKRKIKWRQSRKVFAAKRLPIEHGAKGRVQAADRFSPCW